MNYRQEARRGQLLELGAGKPPVLVVLRHTDLRVYCENHLVLRSLSKIIPGHLLATGVRLGFLEPFAPAEMKLRNPRLFPGFTDRCFERGFSGLDLNWDFAKEWKTEAAEQDGGSFRTSFWIGSRF